jgi:hypothetical protein
VFQPGRIARGVVQQSVWLTPLIALAGVHAYILDQQSQGDAHWRRGDFAGALPYYVRSARWPAIDGPGRAFVFKLAWCNQMTGNEEAAYRAYMTGLRLYADAAPLYTGLAELYLESKDPRFHHPEQVPALAEQVRRCATRDYERRDADRLIARARKRLQPQSQRGERR